jgi:RNA-directed DNA polymerase
MMHEREKSDPAVVAAKSANEAGQPGEEWMEPRAGAKENVDRQSTLRAQDRAGVSQALGRIRGGPRTCGLLVTYPRWEPDAGKPHVRFCAGGA